MIHYVHALRLICPLTIVLCIASVVTGSLQWYFADDVYDAKKGCGIWAGLTVMGAAVNGLICGFYFKYEFPAGNGKDDEEQKSTMSLFFRGFPYATMLSTLFCVQDIIQSALVLVDCTGPVSSSYCSVMFAGTIAMAAVNLTLGLTLMSICMVFVYIWHVTRRQMGIKCCGSLNKPTEPIDASIMVPIMAPMVAPIVVPMVAPNNAHSAA